MAKASKGIGGWAFIIGVIIAILVGLLGSVTSWLWVLVVVGLIVRFLNLSGKESSSFLLAAVSLVIVTVLGDNVMSSVAVLGRILNAITAMVVPATVIVALKSIYSLAKN